MTLLRGDIMDKVNNYPECDFQAEDWEPHDYLSCNFDADKHFKILTIYQDAKGYLYYNVEGLAFLLGFKYSGFKDSSAFAKAIFDNSIIVLCRDDETFNDEHFCRLETLNDVLDALEPLADQKLLGSVRSWLNANYFNLPPKKFADMVGVAVLDVLSISNALNNVANLNTSHFTCFSMNKYTELYDAVINDLYRNECYLHKLLYNARPAPKN